MNLRLAATVSVLVAALSSCFHDYAQCTAVCVPSITATLVDAQGSAVSPGTGTVTIGGRTEEFDCRRGTAGQTPDGGALALVGCSNNTLSIGTGDGSLAKSLTLSVRSADGTRQFSGDVPLSFTATGASICGSQCRVAAPTVTLQ